MFEDIIDGDNEEYDEALEKQPITTSINKLYREWATINGLKDMLGLALKGTKNVTYSDIVTFGADIAPAILGPDRTLFNAKKSNLLYQEYEERATALSFKEEKEISILEALDRSIKEYQELINTGATKNLST